MCATRTHSLFIEPFRCGNDVRPTVTQTQLIADLPILLELSLVIYCKVTLILGNMIPLTLRSRSSQHGGCWWPGWHEHSRYHVDGLVQERRYSSAFAIELRLSSVNPSICVPSVWHLHAHHRKTCETKFLISYAHTIASLKLVHLVENQSCCLLKIGIFFYILPVNRMWLGRFSYTVEVGEWISNFIPHWWMLSTSGVKTSNTKIRLETRWPPFPRRHFQTHLLEWKSKNLD